MTALERLQATRVLEDLPRLAEALGCCSTWQEIPAGYWQTRSTDPPFCGRSALVGDQHGLPWYAVEASAPGRTVRTLARRLLRRGETAAVFTLDPASSALSLSVAFDGLPVLSLKPAEDQPVLLACLARIPAITGEGRLATAARLAEILSLEGLGNRFFIAFEKQLNAMTEGMTGCRAPDRRALALLQLNRALFLYFVQSKGWLDGKPDFLRLQVDRCLERNKRLDQHLLRPLFFGTLNRPWQERGRGARAFGRIPFLNGGLFEPHPLERRWTGTISNSLWREAFDSLFERFQFTATERAGAAIAPDMLGRVFEGVMAPEERRRSGTFYTPPTLVQSLLDECLVVFISRHAGLTVARAAELLANRDRLITPLLTRLTLLDPAAGSGAFLLAALERLSELTRSEAESVAAARRRILLTNLFGVDINPTAVRLTELRLWLSVIADDEAETPERVAPLPNLDCLVRQGDSLTDPLGLIAQMPFRLGAMGTALAGLRKAFTTATGGHKAEAARLLRAAELAAMRDCLALAEDQLNASISDAIRGARTPDLFGDIPGASRSLSRRLTALRKRVMPIRQARRRLDEQGEVGWFQYEAHFADVFSSRGGFDVVIGNPPWVRAEKLPRTVREHLGSRYCWWRREGPPGTGYRHQPDLAVAFLERAHELVRIGGVVGLLVPAKLGTAGYGAAARGALTRDLTLHTVGVLDSAVAAAFDATVYPMALVTSKEKPPTDHQVRLSLGNPEGTSIPQTALSGGGPWIIRGPDAAGIAKELAGRFTCIAHSGSIHLGVKTGANEVFLNPPASIEPALVREAFRGRDIRPFRIIRTVRLLWPCAANGKALARLPHGALGHVRAHADRLRARADQGSGPLWSLFRTAAASGGPRVVWADLSRTLTSVPLASDDPRIPLNTCYLLKAGAAEAPVLAAWLNSSWMRGLARLQADPASSGFARFNARTVGSLPLPDSVRHDAGLAAFAREAATGNWSQGDLDELTASHLDLPSAALRTLASVA